jgi:hypothetical protein
MMIRATTGRTDDMRYGLFRPTLSDNLPIGIRITIFAKPRNAKNKLMIEAEKNNCVSEYTGKRVLKRNKGKPNVSLPKRIDTAFLDINKSRNDLRKLTVSTIAVESPLESKRPLGRPPKREMINPTKGKQDITRNTELYDK